MLYFVCDIPIAVPRAFLNRRDAAEQQAARKRQKIGEDYAEFSASRYFWGAFAL